MINTIESIDPEKILFCDYIIVWNNETKYRKSPSTYDGYVGIITKYLYPYFKAKGLCLIDVKPMHIEGYQRHILHDTSLSVNTLRKHHEVMRACLNYAYRNDFIQKNPYNAFSLPRKEENEMCYYSEKQLIQLMRVAYGTQIESFVYLAVWFGLRKSEVLGLRWDNVDFENKCLYICETRTRIKDYASGHWIESQNVRMKTVKSKRVFPLSIEQLKYLSDLQRRQMLVSQSGYVCVNSQGEPLHYDYVLHAFQKLLRENDLPKIRIHDLRHSNATLMLNSGFSMKQVSEWLGHSTYKLTADTYTHVSAENKVEMSNAIGHKLSPFSVTSEVIRFDCAVKGCDLCDIYRYVCADCPCSDKCANCANRGSDVCDKCCLDF